MECVICKETKNKEVFNCDGCRNSICKACGNLTSSEVKVLQLKEGRTLKFYCPRCQNCDNISLLQKIILDKETIIEDKNEIIRLLKNEYEELKKVKNNNESTCKIWQGKSYANIAAKPNMKMNIPSLIIKPKTAQNLEKTKNDLQANIKPADLNVGINNWKATKNGNIIIKCPSVQDVETLKKAADDKLKNNYEIETTKMQKPKIKIAGYNGNKTVDEIEECLRRQNGWIAISDELKITYMKQRENLNYTIFGECSSELYHKFMNAKKVYIDWERYPIYEDISVTKCFNCQGFFHKHNKCNNKKVCEICASEHDKADCPKQVIKCNNCTLANSKYNLKYQTNHKASDPECPTYKYQFEILKSKIDYGQ